MEAKSISAGYCRLVREGWTEYRHGSGVYIKPNVETLQRRSRSWISVSLYFSRSAGTRSSRSRCAAPGGAVARFPVARYWPSCDSKFRELIDRSRQHGFVPAYNNRPLYEFRVVCHQLEQLIIAEILAGYLLAVRWFICPQHILRLQSRATQ